MTSGSDPPTKAVSSFSWAADQGTCCATTRTPGFSRSKSRTISCTTSPSRPIAQKRSGALCRAERAHDVRVAAHGPPHQPGPVVLDHRQDRTLIDAEVVGVEPAAPGNDPSVME